MMQNIPIVNAMYFLYHRFQLDSALTFLKADESGFLKNLNSPRCRSKMFWLFRITKLSN